ncbi:MAG TPA: carboxypeptidase regulatory-like domain-containing protein [Acidobacteriaceae bacterium]
MASANAQVTGGTINGVITDASGAVISEAQVTVTESDTQVSRRIAVNREGLYSAPNLRPGTYEVSAVAAGFQTVVRSGVTLTVGGELVVDLQLPPGKVDQTVNVVGDVFAVNLSSASLTDVVNATTVRELSLNGRDWTQLATLQPGVDTVLQNNLGISNDRANRGLGTQMTIGGNRPQQNNYRLDGISINDYSNGAPGSVLGINLGVDAIQEFSVITNNADASYGRSSGGIINAITRSGTNDIHGSAYEFIRNSALDARNYFDKAKVPPFKRNQFGAAAGGPIWRDHTFFFGNYEGLRQALSVTQLSVVPSQAARNGQLAAGNVKVDPLVEPYLALFPLPNGTVFGDTGIFNLPLQQVTREDFFTVRVDHALSPADNLFGTYMFDDGKTVAPDAFNLDLTAGLTRRQAVVLEATHVFTPALLNTARFGFSRVISENPKTVSTINPAAADTALGFVPGRAVGLISISGLSPFPGGFDSVGEYNFHFNSFQAYDDAFLTRGPHSFKFGLAVERIQDNQLGLSSPSGQYNFASLAGFLTNSPILFMSALSGTLTPRDMRQTIFGVYGLDNVRVRPTFTVNLGLRYEMASVPTESSGKLSNLATLMSTQPRLGSPYFANPTYRNLEPRVGFSWDPFHNGRTSVRAGFGMYDVLPLPYEFELQTILSAPYFRLGTLTNPPMGSFPKMAFGLLKSPILRNAYIDSNPKRNYVMQWNATIQREVFPDLTVFLGYVGSRGVHLPYHLEDFNFVLPTLTAQGYVWPSPRGSGAKINPALGQIDGLIWNSDSIYHALQAQVTRRWHRSLQFGGSYTFAKTIDTGSSSLIADNFPNVTRRLFFDPRSGRGPSDFDTRHNLTMNYVWQIPSQDGSSSVFHWVTNGWQLGGIYQLKSGLPFTPIIGGDPLGMNSTTTFDYADRLGGASCASLVNPGNPTHYIKAQCFAFPNPSTRLGNLRRNSLTGPGLSNFDMSLFKNNPIPKISETFHVQFRAEFFNTFNHANFAPPLSNRTLFTASGFGIPTAGLITSTVTTSRQIQFGLKLIW